MPRLVAALDADVLVPILSCDFLLTAFDLGLYEPVVSIEAIAEVERNLIADFPHLDPVSISRRVGQMRDALEDNFVEPVRSTMFPTRSTRRTATSSPPRSSATRPLSSATT